MSKITEPKIKPSDSKPDPDALIIAKSPRTLDLTGIDPYNICFTLSDLGNAERFSAHLEKICQYVPELNIWRVWDGKAWIDDENLVLLKWRCSLIVRKIYGEAEMYGDQKEREAIVMHAIKSESSERIKGAISLLASQPGMCRPLSNWDADPFLLNVANGTIDLRTGELREHNREDYIARILPIEYDPDAECPLWLTFLDRVTAGDTSLIEYLQRASGYSLTGDTREQIFFFLYGHGNNGKSVFTGTIRKMLGPYATRVSTDLFMIKDKASAGGPKEGLANLRNKRLVIATELEDGKKLATSLIKDLTGGETIRADRKYQHEIEFMPECKLWMAGNHKPVIKDTTLSIWRRVKLVPYTVTIPPVDIDKGLQAKLEQEYPGILSWAVQGCVSWFMDGWCEPSMVTDATTEYRDESDILKDYLIECCFLNSAANITLSELYKNYTEWAGQNDIQPIGKRNFTERLIEKGINKGSGNYHRTTMFGIRLLTEFEKIENDNSGNNDNDIPVNSSMTHTRREKHGKMVTKLSKLPDILPDCPDCGKNEWSYTQDGRLKCPCGHIIEVEK